MLYTNIFGGDVHVVRLVINFIIVHVSVSLLGAGSLFRVNGHMWISFFMIQYSKLLYSYFIQKIIRYTEVYVLKGVETKSCWVKRIEWWNAGSVGPARMCRERENLDRPILRD